MKDREMESFELGWNQFTHDQLWDDIERCNCLIRLEWLRDTMTGEECRELAAALEVVKNLAPHVLFDYQMAIAEGKI